MSSIKWQIILLILIHQWATRMNWGEDVVFKICTQVLFHYNYKFQCLGDNPNESKWIQLLNKNWLFNSVGLQWDIYLDSGGGGGKHTTSLSLTEKEMTNYQSFKGGIWTVTHRLNVVFCWLWLQSSAQCAVGDSHTNSYMSLVFVIRTFPSHPSMLQEQYLRYIVFI